MSQEILIDEDDRVVAGYWVMYPVDGTPDLRGQAVIARAESTGPQDLCAQRNEKCWVVESTDDASQQLWDIGYWEDGAQVFQRTRTANTTWPTVLIDSTLWTLNIDADGDGNLYFIKYNRTDAGTHNARGFDPVIALQRTTTGNSHTAATVSVDTLAPSGPAGTTFFKGGRVRAVMVQNSGLLAICDWRYTQNSDGTGTAKTISGVLEISSSLVGSTGVLIDEDVPLTAAHRPLGDGAMIWFTRTSGGGAKTAHVDSAGSITNEVAAIPDNAGWYFDSFGQYWTWDLSGSTYSYKKYSSSLSDVTPSWLAGIGGENGSRFIVSSSAHRFVHTIWDSTLLQTRYRVYDSDGVKLLDREVLVGGGTEGGLAVGYLGGNPNPMNSSGGTGVLSWTQTTDSRFVHRNQFYKGPAKSNVNWDYGIMKQAPDSILATALVANSRLNTTGFPRYQVHVCRGNHANFDYSGW